MDRQPPALASLIPPELLTAVLGHRLQVGQRIRGTALGRHRSRRSGEGQEFLEHRAYSPGDDLRRIDWRAVARHDRLVLRRDHSEDQLTLALCVDRTGALQQPHNPQSRDVYICALVAALATLAVRQGDRLAYAIYTGAHTNYEQLRPRVGTAALTGLSQGLHAVAGGQPCPWLAWVQRAQVQLPRRSLVVVCSDFLDPFPGRAPEDRSGDVEVLQALASLRSRGHTVVVVQSLLAEELAFPWHGRRQLEVRTPHGRRPPVQGPEMSLRSDYLQTLRAHLDWFAERCEQLGLRRVAAVTARPLAETLLELLAVCAGQVVAGTREVVG